MKRIVISIFLSLLLPGLGQMYNRDYKKGIFILVAVILLIAVPITWIMLQTMPLINESFTQEMVQKVTMEVTHRNRHMLALCSYTILGFVAYAITQCYFRSKELNEQDNPTEEES